MMKLYKFAPTRSIRVRWALQELDVPFEAVTLNLAARRAPQPRIPQGQSGRQAAGAGRRRFRAPESIAIVLYLAEKYPAKQLMPTSLRERAQAYRWLLFTTTELVQPLWRIARHSNIYSADKRLPAEIELARADFLPMAQVIEDHMRDREFIVADHVTVVDFVLAYTLDWAKLVKLLDGFPTHSMLIRRACMRGRTRRCASSRPSRASGARRANTVASQARMHRTPPRIARGIDPAPAGSHGGSRRE